MKYLRLFLAVLLTAVLLCSCVPDTAPAPVPEPPAPIDFTWKPYVNNAYVTEAKGDTLDQQLREAVDAVLNQKECSPCKDEETYDLLIGTLMENCPFFLYILQDYWYEDGCLWYSYAMTAGEQKKFIEEFAKQVENIIEEAVCETDTPLMALISLYHSYSCDIRYDYEGMDDDSGEVDFSPYRGIMEKEGICQTFAPAFAYLCMQMGIDAIDVGGLHSGGGDAHSWVMLRLDGENYFADPTFENGAGGEGLRYFGMNAEQRGLDGYLHEDLNVGWNLVRGKNVRVDSRRFEVLWDVACIDEISRIPEGDMILRCMNTEGNPLTVSISQTGDITVEEIIDS